MPEERVIRIGIFVPSIIKESHELIILFMGKWIIGMAVTLHTGESCPHQGLPRSIYAVKYSCRSELFVISSSFIIGHRVAVKSSGNKLFVCSIWQQVSGQLFDEKLIDSELRKPFNLADFDKKIAELVG